MRRTLLSLSLTALVALASLPANAQKRAITETDLFAFNWIGDTQLSPDGHTIVFVQASVTPDHSGYQSSLYTLDLTTPGATPKLLTPGTHDSNPRWNSNGSQLAFLRSVEKDGKPTPPQLYFMSILPQLSSPIRLTDLPKGVSNPQWCPNGAGLAVLSATLRDPADKLKAAVKARSTGDDAHISDVRIIDRAVYRANGEGYLDPTYVPQLYDIELPVGDQPQPPPLLLTNRRFGISEYTWANSSWIVYTADLVDEPIYEAIPHNGLYAFDPKTGKAKTPLKLGDDPLPIVTITEKLPYEMRGISLSQTPPLPSKFPAHLAFHADEPPPPGGATHQQTNLFTLDLDWSSGNPVLKGAPRDLTSGSQYETGSGVGGDNTAPRGGGRTAISWSADGTELYDVAGKEGSAFLVSVSTDKGTITELTRSKEAVLTFSSTPDRKTTIALISSPILIGDLFSIGPDLAQTQLTHVNDALFSQLNLTMPLDLQVAPTVHAADIQNHPIDTFIQLPADYKPGTKLPLILNIHGGPHSAYGWVFDHEMQWMAAKGYVVVYPNPRGSTTYGENFANVIMNNYPGDDFHDLMDTVDVAIKLGYADPERLGVTGGSGGGLLTDWVVTQTTRFKAAVAQRDITDWANWWYTADAAGFHQSFYPKTPPFDNTALYAAHSPLTFVNNIRTPMMFILGDADYRTPPTSGGEVFFRALKYKCIPTVMVRFPRESHELSRSGEPWHRVERLENIVNWFDLYLLHEPKPQYDVAPNYTAPCATKP